MLIQEIGEHELEYYLEDVTIRKCGLCDEEITGRKLMEDHFTSNYGLKKSEIENYKKTKR